MRTCLCISFVQFRESGKDIAAQTKTLRIQLLKEN